MAVTQNNLVNGDYEYSHTQFKLHHWAPNNKHTIHFQQWLSYIHPSIIATNIHSYIHIYMYTITRARVYCNITSTSILRPTQLQIFRL